MVASTKPQDPKTITVELSYEELLSAYSATWRLASDLQGYCNRCQPEYHHKLRAERATKKLNAAILEHEEKERKSNNV